MQMRPGVGFKPRNSAAAATTPPSAAPGVPQHSAWQSPVPYLFGGLAAMLGLIAFALLILACSYWKLSGYLDSGGDGTNGRGAEGEASGRGDDAAKPPSPFEESIVIIMPGDCKPTFLATPIASCAASFGNEESSTDAVADRKKTKNEEVIPPPGDMNRNQSHLENCNQLLRSSSSN